MSSATDYANLATYVYSKWGVGANIIKLPADWHLLGGPADNPATGFHAQAFQNGNSIVISFRGTDDAIDWVSNFGFGNLGPMPQLADMKAFVDSIIANNPGAELSFTGHSLGGGLAALASVIYDKPATVFDPAPYGMYDQTSLTTMLATLNAGSVLYTLVQDIINIQNGG